MMDGQSFSGKAEPTTFTVKGADGVFKVPAKKISSITFERGNPSGSDELLLKSGSRIRGGVFPDPVPFQVADTGQTMKFAQARIHTLVMFFDKDD
jgi:hypothetical protein